MIEQILNVIAILSLLCVLVTVGGIFIGLVIFLISSIVKLVKYVLL